MTRVAAFVVLLGLVFAAALGLGRLVDADARAAAEEPAAAHGGTAAEEEMGDEHESEPAGLAVASDGFRLELVRAVSRGRDEIAFRIVDAGGAAVRDYDIVHEKPMHLVLARRDLGDFQHLHPALGADGVWRATTTFLPGTYRAFADFESAGERVVLGGDVSVGGAFAVRAAPAPARVAAAGPYRVRLEPARLEAGVETPVSFTITRDGRKVQPEPYLGARGHLVVLREGDLAYIHAHPREDAAEAVFDTTLPTAGRYRAYLQFSAGGRVHTAEWALEAA